MPRYSQRWASRLKRLIDLALVLAASPVAVPLVLAAAGAVWLTMGRPVLFRQVRIGLHEHPFTIWKLRTMRDAAGPDGQPLPDELRLTRVGRFLRATSLDELPELWNVLRGEMSLVGPRPLLPEYLLLYNERQRKRHLMRPGITGWAQVNGRNALSWSERLEMDVWYVENWSLWLDLRILARTVWQVLRVHDVSHPGHASMPPFRGADDDG